MHNGHHPPGPSRAERIADGQLVDVTERAREIGVGWPYPLAMTREVWHYCVAWPGGDAERERRRLAEMLVDIALQMLGLVVIGTPPIRIGVKIRCNPPGYAEIGLLLPLVVELDFDDDGHTPATTIMMLDQR